MLNEFRLGLFFFIVRWTMWLIPNTPEGIAVYQWLSGISMIGEYERMKKYMDGVAGNPDSTPPATDERK